jgi:hypothetical protein
MKLRKAEVLRFIDDAFERHRQAYDQRVKAYDKKYAAAIARWMETEAPRWMEALDKIKGALRKGNPITEDAFPKERRYGGIGFFSMTEAKPGPYEPPRDLVSVRAYVQAVADDTITDCLMVRYLFENHSSGQVGRRRR